MKNARRTIGSVTGCLAAMFVVGVACAPSLRDARAQATTEPPGRPTVPNPPTIIIDSSDGTALAFMLDPSTSLSLGTDEDALDSRFFQKNAKIEIRTSANAPVGEVNAAAIVLEGNQGVMVAHTKVGNDDHLSWTCVENGELRRLKPGGENGKVPPCMWSPKAMSTSKFRGRKDAGGGYNDKRLYISGGSY